MRRKAAFISMALWMAALGARGAAVVEADALRAPFAPRPIVVDGAFDDWPDVKASRVAPFRDVAGYADPAMSQVFAKHPELIDCEAEVMMAHDRDNLYLGARASRAAFLAVHARDADGRVSRVVWWRDEKGGQPRVEAAAREKLTTVKPQSATRVGEGGRHDVEIAVPWVALGYAEGAPQRLDLVWSVVFTGVNRELLAALPQEMRVAAKIHTTYNVLTSLDKVGSRGYLQRPEWWGTLVLGDAGAPPPEMLENVKGTGLTEWVVPKAERPVTVDGNADEWDWKALRSPALAPWAYHENYTGIDMGLRWDEQMLYMVFRRHGAWEPFNTEAAGGQMGFRGGDCVQIRFKDGDRVSNLCGWWDTRNKVSALTADGKERKNPDLLADGALQAFGEKPLPFAQALLADDDDSNYAQEIGIPWRHLLKEGNAPAVGQRFPMTFQLWWSGVDNPQFSVETAVDFEQPPPVRTTYDLPRDASVSLGVFNEKGELLRHLVREEMRVKGANVEAWDGLDQWGKVLPAGRYTLKGIHHEPFALEYVMSANNPGTPPWWTVDGKGGWLSDQAAPQAVVTDGTNVYIAAPYAEAGHAIIAVGPDGKRIWGVSPHGYTPRAVSLALMGGRLYATFSGPELTEKVRAFKQGDATARERVMMQCFDARTGELAGISAKSGAPVVIEPWAYRHDVRGLWDLRLSKAFSPSTYGGMHRYSDTGMCETTGSLGLAAAGDRLVVSLLYSNELIVVDPATAKVLKRIPLDAPAGLHGLDASAVLAVSGTRVVRVDIGTGAVTPVIADGLSAPFGVTTDARGNIFVSDWGASFQVKKFTPQGRPVRAIGKAGGRPWVGAWAAEGMAVPRGIAVTADNKLWVAEDEFSPRRVSVWDADTGRLVRDYIGPANYRGWGVALDPKDITRLVTCGTEFKLDFAAKACAPVRKLFLRRGRDDCFTPDGNGMASSGRFMYRDGKEFLVLAGGAMLTILQRRGEEYRPVAALSGLEANGRTTDGTDRSFWDSDLMYHFLPGWYPEFFKGHAGDNHIWNDLNGDGIAQEGEVAFAKTLRRGEKYEEGRMGEWGCGWGIGIGPDFAVYVRGFCRDASIIHRLDPVFTEDGLPQYSFERCTPVIFQDTTQDKRGVSSVYASDSGLLYVTYDNNLAREIIADKALTCYTRDGRERWSIAGPRDHAPKSVYGYPCASFDLPGVGTGVATWVWWHNCRVYLITDDGLYLGGFLDTETGTGPGFVRLGGEVSAYAQQAPDGRLYIINGNDSAQHYHEVKGLRTCQRFEQPLVITDADAAAAARALTAAARPAKEQPVIYIGRGDPAEGVTLTTARKPGRGAAIALTTDGAHLRVTAKVSDETPMVNDGQNWQTPFITGDCIDIMLATDPKADPARRAPAPGDIRIILTELRGEPLAVLYRPVAKDGPKAPAQMLAATLDDVRRLPPSCNPTVRRGKDGYTLTASIPLAALGLTALPPETRGDLGVIYGDATGRDRDQRLYYYNKATAMISDLTAEATLTPDRWGPVLTGYPGNILRNGSFEAPLDKAADWTLREQRSGATAAPTAAFAFDGRSALLLQQEIPLKLPPRFDNTQDYGELYKQLNDGAGGGYTVAAQRAPVTPGQAYNLRFAYRSEQMMREMKGVRPGYAIFSILISWHDAQGKECGNEYAFRLEEDIDNWRVAVNPRGGYVPVEGLPFVAPKDAAQVQVALRLAVTHNTLARTYIDAIEFAPAPK